MRLCLLCFVFFYVQNIALSHILLIYGLFLVGGGLVIRLFYKYIRQKHQYKLVNSVLEGSRAARLITDKNDKTIYANRKFRKLCAGLGKPSYEAMLKLFDGNEEAESHLRFLADKVGRGLTDSIELRADEDDIERWLLITAQPVIGHKDLVHWRIDDVTEKFVVQREADEERQKLIDFTDNAPVGFFSVNEQGRFVLANATFARWLGQDLNTLLDQGFLHNYLVHPPTDGRPYDLTSEQSARQIVELEMKGAGGRILRAAVNQVVYKEADGSVRTTSIVNDLTAQSEMRSALQQSEDRFRRFFEEAPVGIVLVNVKGKIADCNAHFSEMLGRNVKDIEGEDLAKLIDAKAGRGDVLKTLSSIEKGNNHQGPLEVGLKADDEIIDTRMYARRFRESDNTVLHFIDVSEVKKLEEQFVQSQKMQAIGQLAGGVAHDFNNLLTAITGFCDLLLLRHKPGDASFGDIMQIKQNSNRAANLVRQLLAFSRQQTLRPKVHDVTDILTEISHLLRRLIGASVELEVKHGQDLGLVKVDEGQMEQVLINLAVNARDAMKGSGQLTIQTENFTNRKKKQLVSDTLPPAHWVKITVSDTGCGIPKENFSRIFEPFFTTKNVGEGTGLGLATVYGIIRQTDGYLDVVSKSGKGTSFILYLPRATDLDETEDDNDVEAAEDVPEDLTGTERILLVEDEDAVRAFSQRALSNKGYDVVTAETGENALEVLANMTDKKLDLLITDVVMPNMDGPTLVQRVRQDSPKLKVIFISGYTEDKLRDYMGKGTYFLPKPFTLKQLAEKVKDVLRD